MPEALTDAQKVLRNDTGKRIAVALEALASEVDPSTVIAPEYDETQTYAVGDLVIYRSVLYRCTTAITTPEAWTAAHWTAVTVADELADKYENPTGGIPKTDLASAVQTSLDKADTALQSVPSTYRTAAEQDVIDSGLNSAITALQNVQQYHKGDTFTINSGLMLMAAASVSGTAGGAIINLPKGIGSDVNATGFTWTGTINFWAEVSHPNGITGLTITGIVKTSSSNLALNFSFPSGTTLTARTMGFLNMNQLTITFN